MTGIRYMTPGSQPFDPLELAEKTERIVCSVKKRKYTSFYATGVYGGIVTGYAVGCCLRCFYCWVDWSRDYPEKVERYYSPEEVLEELKNAARKAGVKKARISNSEPTIGKTHLLHLLKLIEESDFELFILETNGVLFGSDLDYVKALRDFSKVHVRLSLKAGNPEGWMRRTGACKESFELPYRGTENLRSQGISFHVAAMTDQRIMDSEERAALIEKVRRTSSSLANRIEEEVIDPYDTTLARLKLAGVEMEWRGGRSL